MRHLIYIFSLIVQKTVINCYLYVAYMILYVYELRKQREVINDSFRSAIK